MDDVRVTIGEFSRMTHLSAKALRLYHGEGILVPAEVDPATGYRWYGLDQVATAQVVRRLRELDLPLDDVRALLTAPTAADRGDLLAAHLSRMEAELARTVDTVASLRRLLVDGPVDVEVEHRSVPATAVLAVRATITLADLGPWWTQAFAVLDAAVATGGARAVGPRGALFATALFADERGEVAAFRPVDPASVPDGPPAGTTVETLPAVELAVAVHAGPDVDTDRVYGALGRYVATHALGVPGPVRETYLTWPVDDPSAHPVTEIGWPVFALTH